MMRRKIAGAVLRASAGPEWCGLDTLPPGDRLVLRIPVPGGASLDDVQVYATDNDGHDLMVGWPQEWRWTMDRKTARRVAWFILWTWWAKAEFFGLRRAIYYRALRAYLRPLVGGRR